MKHLTTISLLTLITFATNAAENQEKEVRSTRTKEFVSQFLQNPLTYQEIFSKRYTLFNQEQDADHQEFRKLSEDLVNYFEIHQEVKEHIRAAEVLFDDLKRESRKINHVTKDKEREMFHLNRKRVKITKKIEDLLLTYQPYAKTSAHFFKNAELVGDDEITVMKFMFAFSLNLTLADMYTEVWSDYFNNKKLRRQLDKHSQEVLHEKPFSGVANEIFSLAPMRSFSHMRNCYRILILRSREFPPTFSFSNAENPAIPGLARAIDSSQFYLHNQVDNIAGALIDYSKKGFKKIARIYGKSALDNGATMARTVKGTFTNYFGNTIGSMHTKSASSFYKIYAEDPKSKKERLAEGESEIGNLPLLINDIHQELHILDIFLEKTAKITSNMIGPFGHAAVWIGAPADWRRYGIYDEVLDIFEKWYEKSQETTKGSTRIKRMESIYQNFHNSIAENQEGRSPAATNFFIAEATKPGVVLNNLYRFLNVDDFLVIRPTVKNHLLGDKGFEAEDREIILRGIKSAINNLGKDYNYEFSHDSQKSLYCSQLVTFALEDAKIPGLTFQGNEVLSEWTMRPQDLAELSMPGNSSDSERLFHPVMFFQGGIRIEGNVDNPGIMEEAISIQLKRTKKSLYDKITSNLID